MVARMVASMSSVGSSACSGHRLPEGRRQGVMPLVLAALPQPLAIRGGRPEVVDDDPVRARVDLDPLLARRRGGAAVADAGQRAVREAQRHHRVVGCSARTAAGQRGHVLDRRADQRLRGVHEVAYLAQQPPALPPVPVPVAVRDRPGRDPVDDQLGRGDPGERPPRRGHGRGPAAVEADGEHAPGLQPGGPHRVELVLGQRDGLLAPHVVARGEGPRRRARRACRAGSRSRRRRRRGRRGPRPAPATAFSKPCRCAARVAVRPLAEATATRRLKPAARQRGQQRPGGERARARPGRRRAPPARRRSAARRRRARRTSDRHRLARIRPARVVEPDGQVGLGPLLDQLVGRRRPGRCRRCASPGRAPRAGPRPAGQAPPRSCAPPTSGPARPGSRRPMPHRTGRSDRDRRSGRTAVDSSRS